MVANEILNDQEIKEKKIDEFRKGRRPDGSRIGTYKSLDYAMFKQSINPQANGFVDLILTKSFTENLYPKKTKPSNFLFESSDEKAPKLFGKYGSDLKGINRVTFNKLQKDKYAPALVREIKRITNL